MVGRHSYGEEEVQRAAEFQASEGANGLSSSEVAKLAPATSRAGKAREPRRAFWVARCELPSSRVRPASKRLSKGRMTRAGIFVDAAGVGDGMNIGGQCSRYLRPNAIPGTDQISIEPSARALSGDWCTSH